MGSSRQVFHALWSLQAAVVLVTLLLLAGAVKPDLALPSLASAQAEEFLEPAAKNLSAQEAITAGPGTTLDKVNQTSSNSGGGNTVDQPKPDCDEKPCIALTFDDGPNTKNTASILKILESEKVDASFFLIGRNVIGNEGLVKRMAHDGFEIGNHTWNHPDLKKLKGAQIKEEILSTQAIIVSAGAPLPTLFRPPYGSVDARVRHAVGLQTVLWNEDPEDWGTNNPKKLEKNILKSAKAGGVIDMHDIQPVTVKALKPVIHALKKKGFQFVTVSELMDAAKEKAGGKPFYGLYLP